MHDDADMLTVELCKWERESEVVLELLSLCADLKRLVANITHSSFPGQPR